MSNVYASGKHAIGICDVCGFQFKLHELRPNIVKQRPTGILACRVCNDPDHPQLMLGTFPIYDPQAIRNPRSDANTRVASRNTQYGWAPIGGPPVTDTNTVTLLAMVATVGAVTFEDAPIVADEYQLLNAILDSAGRPILTLTGIPLVSE